MVRFTVRFLVAIVTFTFGVAIAMIWLTGSAHFQRSRISSTPQSQPTVDFRSEDAGLLEYQMARLLRFDLTKPYGRTEVFISVEPQYFTREKMSALAQQLNRDFSTEPKLYVRILDDYDIARNFSPVAYERPVFVKAWRGEYSVDRKTGEEYISFSTERGRPIDEVKINLGKALSNNSFNRSADCVPLIVNSCGKS